MLAFRPTPGEKSSYSVQRASYLALKDDIEFGRVDCCDPTDGAGEGIICAWDNRFECRIQITGKGRWAHVPADWVMYDEGARRHVARTEGARTLFVEGGERHNPLRL